MSNNSKFRPMSELPTKRPISVLVKLEEKILGSWLHVMTIQKDGQGKDLKIVASNFHFDMPEIVGWTELPDDEEEDE